MDVHPDVLLQELRLGEREAFVRYYESYRAPVYNFVRRLLHDEAAAVPATQDVFTSEYRRILLHDDGIALRERTYRAAFDLCRRRLDEREVDRGAAGGHAVEGSELGRRFAQALEVLPLPYQAVLLLHDVNGLRPAEMATVFGVTEDAAGALLFRAREEFRRAFEELSSDGHAATCRLAEQTAAGAVGRSLSEGDVRRLHEHAGYCRPCRRTMKAWGGGPIGLALFLTDAPLPQALEATPVFGTPIPMAGATGVIAGSGMLTRAFARFGRSVTSRAAAYALAAACLALTVGLAMHHSSGAQTFIMVPAATPSVPRLEQPLTSIVPSPGSRGGHTGATSTRSASRPAFATNTPATLPAVVTRIPATRAAVVTRIPATRAADATISRPATGSAAPIEAYAGAVKPTATVVADAGGPSSSARPTVGDSAVPGTVAPHSVTHGGNTKTAAETTKGGHGSALRSHTGSGSGSHTRLAKHAGHGGGHAHHAHKKSKQNH